MTHPIAALAALLLAAAPAAAQIQINTGLLPPGGPQVANLPLVVPTPGAPGPAGILGAAAAWHAARRLRRRMREGRP